MKKFLVLCFCILVLAFLVFPADINVTQPASGVSWCKGKTCQIQWTWQNVNKRKRVKLSLWNSAKTQKVLDIALSEADDGDYPWAIPNTLADGDYAIKLKIIGEPISGFSRMFTVKNCSNLSYQGKDKALANPESRVANTNTETVGPYTGQATQRYPDLVIRSMRQAKRSAQQDGKGELFDYLDVIVKNDSELRAYFPAGSEILSASSGSKKLVAVIKSNVASRNLTFQPGETREISFVVGGGPSGQERFPITLKADPGNVLKESREDNNEKTYYFKKELSDLIIEHVIAKEPHSVKGFVITVRIKNVGSGMSRDFLYRENVLKITGSVDIAVEAEKFENLPPGQSRDFEVAISHRIRSGGFFLVEIKVDPDDIIPESNEENNTKSIGFRIE